MPARKGPKKVNKYSNQLKRTAVRLSEAPSFGKTIFEYDSGGTGALAYRDFSREFLKRHRAPVVPPENCKNKLFSGATCGGGHFSVSQAVICGGIAKLRSNWLPNWIGHGVA